MTSLLSLSPEVRAFANFGALALLCLFPPGALPERRKPHRVLVIVLLLLWTGGIGLTFAYTPRLDAYLRLTMGTFLLVSSATLWLGELTGSTAYLWILRLGALVALVRASLTLLETITAALCAWPAVLLLRDWRRVSPACWILLAASILYLHALPATIAFALWQDPPEDSKRRAALIFGACLMLTPWTFLAGVGICSVAWIRLR